MNNKKEKVEESRQKKEPLALCQEHLTDYSKLAFDEKIAKVALAQPLEGGTKKCIVCGKEARWLMTLFQFEEEGRETKMRKT